MPAFTYSVTKLISSVVSSVTSPGPVLRLGDCVSARPSSHSADCGFDFKGWGENERVMLHDKTLFLTLNPQSKNGSRSHVLTTPLSADFLLCV